MPVGNIIDDDSSSSVVLVQDDNTSMIHTYTVYGTCVLLYGGSMYMFSCRVLLYLAAYVHIFIYSTYVQCMKYTVVHLKLLLLPFLVFWTNIRLQYVIMLCNIT